MEFLLVLVSFFSFNFLSELLDNPNHFDRLRHVRSFPPGVAEMYGHKSPGPRWRVWCSRRRSALLIMRVPGVVPDRGAPPAENKEPRWIFMRH